MESSSTEPNTAPLGGFGGCCKSAVPFAILVAGIIFLGFLGKAASRRTYFIVAFAAVIASVWELQS